MLKINIKASQITNLTDARYFAAKEVKWLSFNFVEGTPNSIDPMTARAMFEWVEGVTIMGEFEGATAAEINFYTEGWGLKAVQVGQNTPVVEVAAIQNVPVFKEFVIEEFTNTDYLRREMLPFVGKVAGFQLNFTKNGISWAMLKDAEQMITVADLSALCSEFDIILAIDFEQNMLDEILDMRLLGISVSGGEEEAVGIKTFDDLDEILDVLEIES